MQSSEPSAFLNPFLQAPHVVAPAEHSSLLASVHAVLAAVSHTSMQSSELSALLNPFLQAPHVVAPAEQSSLLAVAQAAISHFSSGK
jgi:hypothetical protein